MPLTTPKIQVYAAVIQQTGTNDPTQTILQNTLGITSVYGWHRANTGFYEYIYPTGLLPLGKTACFIGNDFNVSSGTMMWLSNDVDNHRLILQAEGETDTGEDGVLAYIKVELYN